MFTPDEKLILQGIADNAKSMELLERLMLQPHKKWTDAILSLPNDEAGEMLKVDIKSAQDIRERFELLRRMGGTKPTKSAPVAPE